jgi:hypothetical protein
VIVCGGCSVSIDLLNEWKNKYLSQEWNIYEVCNNP